LTSPIIALTTTLADNEGVPESFATTVRENSACTSRSKADATVMTPDEGLILKLEKKENNI